MESRWEMDGSLTVLYRCAHGGPEASKARMSATVPSKVLAFARLEALPWTDLLNPFPRSVARHGEMSSGARRERRLRAMSQNWRAA